MKKNRWLWLLVFILIAGLTLWTIVSQLDTFDIDKLKIDLKNSNKLWLVLAVISMFGNILFEALAIKTIIKAICPEHKGNGRYILYSSADLYFSAITPFSTGGQPVVAYFMSKDKINIASVTTALILDYVACTFITLIEFLVGFIFYPTFISEYSSLSIILIIIGSISLIMVTVGLIFLLFHSNIFKKIVLFFMNLLNKIIHFKNYDSKIEKLNKTVEDYKECSQIMKKNHKMVLKVFLFTLAQKLGKTLATVFVFFAIIGKYQYGFNVWFAQVASDIGTSLVPLPGGVGATEYILIDGFSKLSFIDSPANLGLMCVAISFYLSIIISGLIVLFFTIIKKKNKTLEQ